MAYEVDRKWESHGLPCVVVVTDMGHRCGYVGVPTSHLLYGKGYSDVMPGIKKSDLAEQEIGDRGIITLFCAAGPGDDVRLDLYFDVHGSLTFSGDGQKGYPVKAPVWWFGFDCAHDGDGPDPEILGRFNSQSRRWDDPSDVIRDETYVIAQCEKLAEQLAALMPVLEKK